MSVLIVMPTPGALFEIAAVFIAAYLAGRTLWWFLWRALERFERSRRSRGVEGVADAVREVAPEDEPSWPGKAPHSPVDVVLCGVVPEEPVETSHPRHALTEVDQMDPILVAVPVEVAGDGR